MGYTHYFDNSPLTTSEWAELTSAARCILTVTDVRVVYDFDDILGGPIVDESRIHLNGEGSDGHETFIINREGTDDFCKTAAKPYDVVVVAILLAAKTIAPDAFDVDTDGILGDWEEGIELLLKAMPDMTRAEVFTPWGKGV